MNSSSEYVCKQDHGMSILATSLPSCDSIDEFIMIASIYNVVYAASHLFMYDRCFIPSTHVIPLIMPPLTLRSSNVSISCIYYSSEVTSFPPLPPKRFKPEFILYFWSIMTPSTCSIQSSLFPVGPNLSPYFKNKDLTQFSYHLPLNVGSYLVVLCLCLFGYLLFDEVFTSSSFYTI